MEETKLRTRTRSDFRADPEPHDWLSIIGLIGILIAFGHSILAMSGEETLAQVYREVESPKLKNFKRAAFIVFIYSLVLTVGISFLAVLLIPDDVRMANIPRQSDRRAGDERDRAACGPSSCCKAFVVVIGFLILAGAVNTAIIGSNGVLNRVAEDGVMPDWFLKPHSKYGTTYRMLALILVLQLFTIIASRRRYDRARRGVCLRRRLELRVQVAGDGRAAVPRSQAARIQGAAQCARSASMKCRSG